MTIASPHVPKGDAMALGGFSRRRVLAGLVAVAAGGAATAQARAAQGAPPKETGLSTEGLLAGRAGFQPRTVMPLPYQELPNFLSRAQLDLHHTEYARDVERLTEVEKGLKDSSLDASRYGELRRAQVTAANSVLLHEFYFGNLAPAKVDVPRYIAGHMNEHIGAMDTWAADFTRCALGAKAWAMLAYDPYDDRWHNVMMAGDDAGAWIGANPLVVCDVSDHAFGTDYRQREQYVEKFIDHVDWNEVARRYKAVDRM
jgi:Fe-Mn family superoxide dismutase